ncbi:MAG: NAD(P)/FAD-dependent oxidoreductase [Pyrinomonadaceae bacterium]
MSKAQEREYDAIIVGGGPAGTSAAIRLAMAGARVLLAEQKRFPRHKLCGEFISPECLAHFAQLGASERMLDAGGVWIKETRFYAPSGKSLRVPSAWLGEASGAQALGLSRAEMDERLLRRAEDAGVDVREGAQAVGLVIQETAIVRGVHLKDETGVYAARAALTVDATGRARSLARHVTGRAQRLSKRATLIAFKAHFKDVRCDEEACEIYFYQGGYGGLNRVEGGSSNLCFIIAAQTAREAKGDIERVMRDMIASNVRAAETLKNARRSSAWLSVALEGFGRSDLVLAPNLIAIGDAASFIDPFTGSGMLMALESGEIAARVIKAWLETPQRASFDALAAQYETHYESKFGARLRSCARLRRAAFAPNFVAEAAVHILSASEGIRRRLTRATRSNHLSNDCAFD